MLFSRFNLVVRKSRRRKPVQKKRTIDEKENPPTRPRQRKDFIPEDITPLVSSPKRQPLRRLKQPNLVTSTPCITERPQRSDCVLLDCLSLNSDVNVTDTQFSTSLVPTSQSVLLNQESSDLEPIKKYHSLLSYNHAAKKKGKSKSKQNKRRKSVSKFLFI